MKNKVLLFSILYSVGQITTGLLLHPYQTMQSLVKQKIFVWMTLLPSLFLSFLTLFWKFVVVVVVKSVFSCTTTQFFGCEWISFVSNIITFFCIYWQVLLLYLLIRFSLAYKD